MVKFCLTLKVSGSEAHVCGKHADGSTNPDAASISTAGRRSVSAAVHSRCLLQHSPESTLRGPKVNTSQRPGFSRHWNLPSRPFRPERRAGRSAAHPRSTRSALGGAPCSALRGPTAAPAIDALGGAETGGGHGGGAALPAELHRG